jgi:hypothetical protein
MQRELIILLAGVALGASLVLSAQRYAKTANDDSISSAMKDRSPGHREFEDEIRSADTHNAAVAEVRRVDIEQIDNRSQADSLSGTAANDRRQQTLQPSPVPEPYDTMLKPRELPATFSTPELYERFRVELRDNAWADSMELGIKQYIAARGADLGLVFDFVECRSRYCVIAGVSYGQDHTPWNTYNPELRSSGWWLASGGDSTVGGTYGNETRFATIISKDPADTLRQ